MGRLGSVLKRWTARREFRRDFARFSAQSRAMGLREPSWEDRYPCLSDRTPSTGFDRHYVLHPAWAARVLARTKPKEHVDIGSSLAFVSQVSAFIPTRFYDYRPASIRLEGLQAGQADLLRLPFADASILSLSCMHVVEHVGLGRYGDALDPAADMRAMQELARVLAPGGDLLFVVPVGRARVQFNAHRVYAHEDVLRAFAGLKLEECALIPETGEWGELIVNPLSARVAQESYGCGCYWFRKVA